MNAKFEVKTTMSDRLMRQASQIYTAMTQRFQKVFRSCVGSVLLAESIFLLWNGYAVGWILLVGGVYLIAAAMLLSKVIYKRTVKANEDHLGLVTTIRFEKNRFIVSSRLNAESIPYADIRKIGENRESFCIISGKVNGTHMPKDSFTLGTAEEFRAFIESKTDKKIKTYR